MNLMLQPGPLYPSRTFLFAPFDPRGEAVTIEIETQGEWELICPPGPTKPNADPMSPGIYRLVFRSHSPQPLVRVTIDPDPGGGRVP